MTELKKCPFCGGEAKIEWIPPLCEYMIECQSCGMGSDPSVSYEDKNTLIQMWNTRTSDENPALTIEELKQMNGEPVWISGKSNTYSLLYYLGEDVIGHEKDCFTSYYFGVNESEFLDVEDYGKTWLAYRRKVEEEVRE